MEKHSHSHSGESYDAVKHSRREPEQGERSKVAEEAELNHYNNVMKVSKLSHIFHDFSSPDLLYLIKAFEFYETHALQWIHNHEVNFSKLSDSHKALLPNFTVCLHQFVNLMSDLCAENCLHRIKSNHFVVALVKTKSFSISCLCHTSCSTIPRWRCTRTSCESVSCPARTTWRKSEVRCGNWYAHRCSIMYGH